MESEELKTELENCQKKLKKANEKIAELKVEMKLQKNQYEGKIKSKEKALDNLVKNNVKLYDRESEKYFMVDSLQKKLDIANKEKLDLKTRIAQLEEENKNLQKQVKDKNAEPRWEKLEFAEKKKN